MSQPLELHVTQAQYYDIQLQMAACQYVSGDITIGVTEAFYTWMHLNFGVELYTKEYKLVVDR